MTARVREYNHSNDRSGFRAYSFYFDMRSGRKVKVVLRFDKGTITISEREAPWRDWVEVRQWKVKT